METQEDIHPPEDLRLARVGIPRVRKDEYDVYDYDDPEDFYYDHEDEFDSFEDAEDYWDEAQ